MHSLSPLISVVVKQSPGKPFHSILARKPPQQLGFNPHPNLFNTILNIIEKLMTTLTLKKRFKKHQKNTKNTKKPQKKTKPRK
jgi:hypothetical protein